MPTAVISPSTRSRLSIRLGAPDTPMKTTRPAGSASASAEAGTRWSSVQSTTASYVTGGGSSAVQYPVAPNDDASERRLPSTARMCTSAPAAAAKAVVSSPMVPGPQTRTRRPGPAPAADAARQALPPGSTRAPERSSIASGSRCRLDAGTSTFSASAPGHPPMIPTS